MKKNIFIIGKVVFLIVIICSSSIVATDNGEILSNNKENDPCLGVLVVTLQEIYGTKDNPQYRPLADVTVTARCLDISKTKAQDMTGEKGYCVLGGLRPGLYMVNAKKDGYIDVSSGVKQCRMIIVNAGYTTYVKFTLAENGSPWDQQTTQTKEPDKLPTSITLKTPSSKETNIETTTWSLGKISVSVEEKYGTKDNPQYRPLADVTVTARCLDLSIAKAQKTTDEKGECYLVGLRPGCYIVTASEEEYVDISSGLKQYQIIRVGAGHTAYAKFILTQEGSPWDLQKTPTNAVVKSDNNIIKIIKPSTLKMENTCKPQMNLKQILPKDIHIDTKIKTNIQNSVIKENLQSSQLSIKPITINTEYEKSQQILTN